MIIQRKGFKIITPAGEDIDLFDKPCVEWGFTLRDYLIFLAGPSPRDDYSRDWRYEAFDLLEKHGFKGVVYSPTNVTFVKNDIEYLKRQVAWEVGGMECADLVVFWIPRSEKDLGLTTNIELGTLLPGPTSMYEIGMPDDAIENDYIKIRLDRKYKEWYNTLEDLIKRVVERSQHPHA